MEIENRIRIPGLEDWEVTKWGAKKGAAPQCNPGKLN